MKTYLKTTSLAVTLVVITFFVINSSFTIKPSGEGYGVGDIAMPFELKNVDGNMVSTSDYGSAKGLIVVFTCNTCPYSKLYESRINDLDDKFAEKGYPVLAINSNDETIKPGDSYEEMVKLAKSSSYSFPYLYDESQDVAKTYGATKTPHVFILQKEGKDLKVAYIGAIDNNAREAKSADTFYVEDAVNSLLDSKEIKTKTSKAIGCSIKWKQS